jgi:hypothetical protein
MTDHEEIQRLAGQLGRHMLDRALDRRYRQTGRALTAAERLRFVQHFVHEMLSREPNTIH